MKRVLLSLSLLVLVAGVASRIRAEDAKKSVAPAAASQQNWYVIESKHTGPECLKTLDAMQSKDLLGKTYWGCMAGDHRGWTILQASNSDAALAMLPDTERANAHIVQVGQFTPDQLKAIHAQHG